MKLATKKKRFYFQAGPSDHAGGATREGESALPCTEASVASVPMPEGAAADWLSSGPSELIDEVRIVETQGRREVTVAFREGCCPTCGKSERRILMLDDLSKRNPPELLPEQREIALSAAQELRQAHIRFDGEGDLHWRLSAPSRVVMTCPRCGRDYIAARPERSTEEDPESIRFLDVSAGPHGVVALEVEGCGNTYRAEVDGGTGYSAVGNRTLYKGLSAYPADCRGSYAFPEAFDLLADAFSVRAIYEYVQGLLPACARLPRRRGIGMDGFQRTVVGNRFRGYPPSFYENVRAPRATFRPNGGSGLNRLPVTYNVSAMEALYSMTPLPQQKRLRKAIFENPHKLRALLHYSDVPFSDPNVLYALVSDVRCDEYLSALSPSQGEVSDVWFFLDGVFGDKRTFDFLRRVTGDEDLKDELDALAKVDIGIDDFDPSTIELLGRLRIADVCRNTPALSLMGEEDKGDICGPIHYSEDQHRLEDEIGGLAFRLPEQYIHLIAAGQEMRNCLGTYIDGVGEGLEAIVLVFDTSRNGGGLLEAMGLSAKAPGKLVAAIRVDDDCETVVEAHTPCNGPMPSEGPLADAFGTWKGSHGIADEDPCKDVFAELPLEPMF